MQQHARLVVIGAGIVGCSTVYHLTRMGWRDIVVLDQGPLFETGGSTSHAPGLVFQTNFSKMMTDLAGMTVDLYASLNLEDQPCFYPVGSLEVAGTPERWEDLKRKVGAAHSWGVEAELISPDDAKAYVPLMDATKICGAYHVPGDGIAKPVRAVEAMAEAAGDAAVFYGHTTVTGIEVKGGSVAAVHTDQGSIKTEHVLICAGIWGPRIGRMAGISIPLTPVQHQYALTAPLEELAGETREVVHPILRHQDAAMYFRQQGDCYGIGSYQHEPLLVDPDDIARPGEGDTQPAIMPFTPEDFAAAHEEAISLLPPLDRLPLTSRINGMFSFTPDGMPLLGESLEARGLWVAEAVWITHAGGVGKVMAEWMTDGVASIDLHEADIYRFPAHVHTSDYVKIRGAQQYREVYDIIHPLQQMEHPRPLRLSPFHDRLRELDGVFFESVGWERPQWFEANAGLVDASDPVRTGWEAFNWSPIQGGEHRAVRERVALYDLTAFTKLEVTGSGALAYLQYITANQVDRPAGSVVYTSMLDSRGGIRCDLTVSRPAPDRFLVLTGGASGMHDLAWMRRHLPDDGSVQITDITSARCGIGLWGPQARQVLSRVCDDDISNESFPYFTARSLMIGTIPVWALRLSYVGEQGWEIYTPTEYGLSLWDVLWEAGQPDGIIALGNGAFDSLRLEKGYRLWGADIHSEYNPFEAGLGWAIRFDKGDFSGREALLRIKQEGVTRKLCCITLDDPRAIVMGKEPVRSPDDGQVLGYVTSANYGYTVRKSIVYGNLPLPFTKAGTPVDVEYFGQRHRGHVTREPLYDPDRTRLTG